jgi:hypothetical protein
MLAAPASPASPMRAPPAAAGGRAAPSTPPRGGPGPAAPASAAPVALPTLTFCCGGAVPGALGAAGPAPGWCAVAAPAAPRTAASAPGVCRSAAPAPLGTGAPSAARCAACCGACSGEGALSPGARQAALRSAGCQVCELTPGAATHGSAFCPPTRMLAHAAATAKHGTADALSTGALQAALRSADRRGCRLTPGAAPRSSPSTPALLVACTAAASAARGLTCRMYSPSNNRATQGNPPASAAHFQNTGTDAHAGHHVPQGGWQARAACGRAGLSTGHPHAARQSWRCVRTPGLQRAAAHLARSGGRAEAPHVLLSAQAAGRHQRHGVLVPARSVVVRPSRVRRLWLTATQQQLARIPQHRRADEPGCEDEAA